MKGLGLIILFFGISYFNFCQIIVDESDFAIVNDTVRYSQSSDLNIDFSSTDTNFIWDFSNLIASSQSLKTYYPVSGVSFLVSAVYGPSAPQDYKASYYLPNNDLPVDQLSQFLPVSISDLYSFSKSTADSITSLGYSLSVNGTAVPFKSDTIETRYRFPIGMDSSWNSRGYTLVNFNPFADFIFKQYRQRTSHVDGWGTLVLPLGNYEVLRVRHDIFEIDSIYQTFFGSGTWIGTPPIQTTEYEWIGKNQKDVLLKIVVQGTSGQQQVQSVEFQDIYLGLDAGINEIESTLHVSPNPTSDFLNIQSSEIIKSIFVVDVNGKILKDFSSVNSLKSIIDISNLTTGFYIVKVHSDKGQKTIRITKN